MNERGTRTTEWRILASDGDESPAIEDDLFDEDESDEEESENEDQRGGGLDPRSQTAPSSEPFAPSGTGWTWRLGRQEPG